jgi:hypothetical protein
MLLGDAGSHRQRGGAKRIAVGNSKRGTRHMRHGPRRKEVRGHKQLCGCVEQGTLSPRLPCAAPPTAPRAENLRSQSHTHTRREQPPWVNAGTHTRLGNAGTCGGVWCEEGRTEGNTPPTPLERLAPPPTRSRKKESHNTGGGFVCLVKLTLGLPGSARQTGPSSWTLSGRSLCANHDCEVNLTQRSHDWCIMSHVTLLYVLRSIRLSSLVLGHQCTPASAGAGS